MSNVGGRKNVQCWWASHWYDDVGRLFEIAFIFGWWPSGEGDGCESREGRGDRDGCGGGCEGGLTQFGGAVREGGCISEVVASGVWLSVGGGCAGNKESSVTSCGGGACRGSGRAS